MEVAICGDWHGNADFAEKVITRVRSKGITTILHCGDFGYGWDMDYIPTIDALLHNAGMRLRWVPGNHENYDMIDYLYDHDAQWMGYRHTIYVLRRGERFTIGTTRFVGIGGAYSIDKAYRRPHVSWWPQETLTYSDVRRIMQQPAKSCDVVIAHDAPRSANLNLRNGYMDDHHTESNRTLLGLAVDHLSPRVVFHGHYHQRMTSLDHAYRPVVGLGDDRGTVEENFVTFRVGGK